MVQGAFGSAYAISETLVRATPLMLTGLAVSIAFRMLFWNIGAEGQLAMGAFAASGVAIFLPKAVPGISAWALLPLMMVGWLRRRRAVGADPCRAQGLSRRQRDHHIADAELRGHPVDPVPLLWPMERPPGLWLSRHEPIRRGCLAAPAEGYGVVAAAFQHGSLALGSGLAIVAAVVVWLILDRTRWGYEIKIIGENPRAARYAGISIVRNILLVMILSGGLAGLAGFVQVAGISHRLQQGIVVGDGYTAIIIAWLAQLNPFGVLLVAVLMAGLFVGGDQIQITMGLSAAVALVLQGAILFFVLGGNFFTQYRIRWTSRQSGRGQ